MNRHSVQRAMSLSYHAEFVVDELRYLKLTNGGIYRSCQILPPLFLNSILSKLISLSIAAVC